MEEVLKNIKESIALADYIERAWRWLTQIKDWNSWQGWLARILIVAVFFGSCLWLLRKGLEWLIAIQEDWKKAGLPVAMSNEQRAAIRRRRQFCKVLRSDLDTLNKAENWNDQFFADLEAEVEAQGWYYASRFDKLIRRRAFGLRRVRSLFQALETSTEQALLLVGEPGSGKSVALRHLAYQVADRGAKSSDLKAKIPLYVNLKELPHPPATGPTADWIRKFVIDNVRRGDADTADYIKEHWDAHLRDGLWLFLFDSFDEIPEVMHAPAGSTSIQQYAEAIRQFLANMSDCRSILASREFKGPESLPWQKFRILPLSVERQNELIEKSFLSSDHKKIIRTRLAESNSNLNQSPLFLALLCRHIKQEGRAPTNDHDLLAKHINRLAERDPEYIKNKHGLTPQQLLDGATELAVLFATDSQLSLAPTYDQIAAALPPDSLTHQRLDSLLSALIDVKIGRSDVQESKPGDRRFTFSHRRYQETLFVRHLSINPQFISAIDLLVDKRWREYTVALLQSAENATIEPILETATQILALLEQKQQSVAVLPGFGDELSYHAWSESEYQLLGILQEGLGKRPELVPPSLTAAVERFLAHRWSTGDLLDRMLVIRYGGLLPAARLSDYLTFAVELKISVMQEIALRRVMFFPSISDKLAKWIRKELSEQALWAWTVQRQLRLQALAARLPTEVGADKVVRRGAWLRATLPSALLVRLIRTFPKPIKGKTTSANDSTETKRYAEPHEVKSSDFIVFATQFYLLSIFLSVLRYTTNQWWFGAAWVVFTLFSIALINYLFCEIVDGKARDYIAALSESRTRLVLTGMYFLGGFGAVYYGGKGTVWGSVVPLSAMMFWGGTSIWEWLSQTKRRRNQQRRLNQFLAQSILPPSFVLQARSLDELCCWMVDARQPVAHSVEFSRSLSRALLHGTEQAVGPKAGPPLIDYLASCEYKTSGLLPPRIGVAMSIIHGFGL
ncbi:hypothetical protein D187_000466 [Cystobacter fuscus DSM 2262]|uniref:NACHT domain-containing protein n=1 Tax=Cystobacter fuscus (strain ATCC 25194 / DSM 2262 / NBRC 100088 / M29) TaxID=1242864 RepID=S9PPT7_CYSF2|nr:NACHT domain-containing protein [Cystobacter fuscus]EPX65041.1 hypothetical protein D187_000466 [Cystobacter fuscus DSM 2262]